MSQFGPSFKAAALLFVMVFGLSAAALYGGAQLVDVPDKVSASAEDEGEVVAGAPVSVTIVGRNSLFDKRSFSVGVGAEVTVTFDNQDAGVPHNIAFYTNRSASSLIAKTDVGPGVRQDVVKFTAPASAGSLFYRCDVHPDTMTGAVSVRQ